MSWYSDWIPGAVESAKRVPDLFPEADGCNVDRALDRGGRRGKTVIPKGTVCVYPFMSMTVLTDGTVPLCCQDPLPEYSMGHIQEESIREIWEDSRWDWIRERHLSGDVTQTPLCQYCTSATKTVEQLQGRYT
jgi:radical SAM protein with 4Fe4S-binding SPASM domain